ERHAAGQLLGHALGHELGVGLGALDLEDVQGDLLAGHLVEVGPDAVGLGAAAADEHARPGRVDVDPHPVAGALDLHPGDAGVAQVPLQVAADLDVLVQVLLVVLLAEPARLPVGGDTQAEAVRVDLLAHYDDSLESTMTVMWLVRLFTREARPSARGRCRFRVGPSSTNALATKRLSAGSWKLCSALAMAESSTLRTGSAAARGVNCRMRRASSTCRPRMRSPIRRALNGVTRTNRACALTSISGLPHSCRPLLRAVDAEGPGRRELAELVADHGLRDVHGHVLAPVVDRDRVPDHVGDDRRAPRPGADHPLVALAVQLVDLLQQVVVHEGTLLPPTRHCFPLTPRAAVLVHQGARSAPRTPQGRRDANVSWDRHLPPSPLAAAADDELVGGLAPAGGD